MSGSNTPVNVVSANGVAAILDANLNAMVQTDANLTTLRGFVGITGMTVILQGGNAAGDGLTGIFYWATGAYTDDSQDVIVPSAAIGQGAWLRARMLRPVPSYTVAGLPVTTATNAGDLAYATNGRNSAETAGNGRGCLVSVNSAGVWIAVWSGVAVVA